MKIRFWGTRGSIATPGPATVRFGGNTSCVEVRSDAGAIAVLDCGTGARLLGQALVTEAAEGGEPASGSLFIGHTHWDHIQGLPFFAPLFVPGNDWHIYGPRGLGQSLADTLSGQMQHAYFPVSIDDLGASVTFHDLVEGRFDVGDLAVRTHYLNHPALTLGYRIEVDGVSVAYASDHEPHDRALAAGGDLCANPGDAGHVEFLRGADVVVHDTQYLAEEYAAKAGWGHSTLEYVVDAARLADVRELVLFHHDPVRDDDAVEAMVRRAQAYAAAVGYAGSVVAAAEGMTIEVGRRVATTAPPSERPESATFSPALEDLSASVVVAAADPAVQATVVAAADAEHLPVVEASPTPESTEAGNTVVVLDHDDGNDMISALRRTVGSSALAARTAVLALTRGRPPAEADALITDWLVWPATLAHVRTKLRAAVLRRACRWQAAPLPPDEERRLRSLRALDVLDTEPEERFDRYTRQACEVFDVPVALVSMVDADRQWFKSRQGVPHQETPRDASLCAHAILGDDVFLVPDLLEDDRFADSPAATGPGRTRFYAGVPLVLSDGSRVGSFCVVDDRPRVLDEAQLDTLRALAALVQEELELSRPAS
ncbi:MAG TPA: MBL fold metallo-hydrolase [Mycobacteriales bacterium]|nr:MBL fold metallo-hydrolase [Mycobacteriales bacterium]